MDTGEIPYNWEGCNEDRAMPGTAVGILMIDQFVKPFARIFEKWPLAMIFILLILYSIVGYIVIKSAYLADGHH